MLMNIGISSLGQFRFRRQPAKEQIALRALVDVKLSAKEARAVWPQLQEHKWYVSEQLGRDVGLRVAAVDYFENIHRVAGHTRSGSVVSRLSRAAGPWLKLYLTHENWKAHDGLFTGGPDEFVWPS